MFHSNIKTRHTASTSMYSLTFAFALQHPSSMDEMERRTQLARHFIAGEGSLRRQA